MIEINVLMRLRIIFMKFNVFMVKMAIFFCGFENSIGTVKQQLLTAKLYLKLLKLFC